MSFDDIYFYDIKIKGRFIFRYSDNVWLDNEFLLDVFFLVYGMLNMV